MSWKTKKRENNANALSMFSTLNNKSFLLQMISYHAIFIRVFYFHVLFIKNVALTQQLISKLYGKVHRYRTSQVQFNLFKSWKIIITVKLTSKWHLLKAEFAGLHHKAMRHIFPIQFTTCLLSYKKFENVWNDFLLCYYHLVNSIDNCRPCKTYYK